MEIEPNFNLIREAGCRIYWAPIGFPPSLHNTARQTANYGISRYLLASSFAFPFERADTFSRRVNHWWFISLLYVGSIRNWVMAHRDITSFSFCFYFGYVFYDKHSWEIIGYKLESSQWKTCPKCHRLAATTISSSSQNTQQSTVVGLSQCLAKATGTEPTNIQSRELARRHSFISELRSTMGPFNFRSLLYDHISSFIFWPGILLVEIGTTCYF